MAEILLFAINKTHSDPWKDQAGCYKRGDPVIVRDNTRVLEPLAQRMGIRVRSSGDGG